MAYRKWDDKAKTYYQELIDRCDVLDSWKGRLNKKLIRIQENKKRYETISKLCGGNIPWFFIAALHDMESNGNFTRHLHNGDSLKKRTWQVPAGRPLVGNPPFSFEESAVDALKMKGFHKESDWSLPRIAYLCEKYNGFGYNSRGRPHSPYLWSGTINYTKGKYVKDFVYDPNHVSKQLGCMPIILALQNSEESKKDKFKEVMKDSRRLTFTERMEKFLAFTGISGLLSFQFLNDVKAFINDHYGLILAGVASIAWLAFKYIQYVSKQEVNEGRYITRNQQLKENE